LFVGRAGILPVIEDEVAAVAGAEEVGREEVGADEPFVAAEPLDDFDPLLDTAPLAGAGAVGEAEVSGTTLAEAPEFAVIAFDTAGFDAPRMSNKPGGRNDGPNRGSLRNDASSRASDAK
jgi:hypothetical protein